MKNINSLIIDIQHQLIKKDWVTEDLASHFSLNLAQQLQKQFKSRQEPPRLRLSRMGPQCPCALWYSIHHPELAEPLPPWAESKYAFGHMIEAWAIYLAKAAGHTVTGEQDELSLDGIVGHRDCVIDGCIVDVKSTSSMGFAKFKTGSIREDDQFGYLDQIDGYLLASRDDPLVQVKDKGYLFAIDKQLGHMTLFEHHLREENILARIKSYKEIVKLQNPPKCTCERVPEGKSGNIKLDMKASYSPFKFCCVPNLRTFIYAKGPVYLTHVNLKPEVIEKDKHGKTIH